MLPIENSVGGSIHRNYDLLLRHRLHIVGEVQLIVNHCLLGMPGVRKEELKRVLSHPQVFFWNLLVLFLFIKFVCCSVRVNWSFSHVWTVYSVRRRNSLCVGEEYMFYLIHCGRTNKDFISSTMSQRSKIPSYTHKKCWHFLCMLMNDDTGTWSMWDCT